MPTRSRIYRILKNSLGIALLGALVWSCQCSGQEKDTTAPDTGRRVNRIEAQREFLQKEDASIQAYIQDRDLNMERSGTGLYYRIIPDSLPGDTTAIQPGDRVNFRSHVYLLNGRKIYQRDRWLRVERQDAIIGLHEALKMMTVGDSGSFILPSHLAYGVPGDRKKVPPYTALHYYLQIEKVE